MLPHNVPTLNAAGSSHQWALARIRPSKHVSIVKPSETIYQARTVGAECVCKV